MKQIKCKYRLSFYLCWLTLGFVCCLNLNALSQYYHFEQYGFTEGLPHTFVGNVVQGQDKRMYATTPEGLAVFNGSNLVLFNRANNLESNKIRSLFADLDGKVWIATAKGGLNYIYRDSIYRVPEIKNKLQGKDIYEIFQRADSTLYFVTGLDVLAVDSDTCYSVWAQIQSSNSNRAGHLAALVQDSILYVNQPDRRFIKINLNNFNWSWINGGHRLPNIIHSMNAIKEGHLFFSGNPGLIEFRSDTFFTIHEHVPGRCWDTDFDEDGNLWLFSEGGGFGKFDPESSRYNGFTSSSGLPTNVLFGGTIDHESNIWLASLNEGLIRFRDHSLMKFNASNGIPLNTIQRMAALGDTLYLASKRGVLLMVDDKIIDTLLADEWINSVYTVADYVLVETLNETYEIYPGRSIVRAEDLYRNFEIEMSRHRFSLTTERVIVQGENFSDTLRIGWTKALESLKDDYIFMLDYAVVLYDGDNTHFLSELDADVYGSFRSMVSWKEGVIIKSDEHLHYVTKRNGNPHVANFKVSVIPQVDQFNAIAINGDSLWMSGLGRFVVFDLNDVIKKKNFEFHVFPYAKSFASSSISNSGLVFHRNKIYAKNSSELIVFDPSKNLQNPHEPPLNLASIKLFGNPMSQTQWENNTTEFRSDENNLSFEMSAHTFAHTDHVRYKYRLVRNDHETSWIGPETENEVVFSHLLDGKYRFEFIANNGQGVWNKTPYQLHFVINKPFWKKPLFWLLLMFFIVVAALLYFLYRKEQRIKRQQVMSSQLIEVQENERKRIARELHDSIGQKIMLMTIQAKEIGADEIKELAEISLTEVRNLSQGLHSVVLDKLGLSAGLKDMIAKVDENTDLLIDYNIEEVDDYIPRERHIHVFRIVQELISNTIKHANATSCSIVINKIGQEVRLYVSDNGRGYPTNLKNNTRLGLQSVIERTILLLAKANFYTENGAHVEVLIPIKSA